MRKRFTWTVTVVLLLLATPGCKELAFRTVPVKCCRRSSVIGRGDVIRVRNTTDKVLALWFEANGQKKEFSLQPYEVTEFGWMEGFTVGENTTYTIGGEGYLSSTFSRRDEQTGC